MCGRERRGLGGGRGEQDQPFAPAEPEGQLRSLGAGLGLQRGWGGLCHILGPGVHGRGGLVPQQPAHRARSPSWKSRVQQQSRSGEPAPGSAAAAGLGGGQGQISVPLLQLLEKGFVCFAEGNSGDGCGMRDKMRFFEDSVLFVITAFVILL